MSDPRATSDSAGSTAPMRDALETEPRGANGTRPLPRPIFLAVLAILLTGAVVAWRIPAHALEGVPNDPSARAAHDLLFQHVFPRCEELRFRSVFLGEAAAGQRIGPIDTLRLERAAELLRRAHEAHPLEARAVAALGDIELAQGRLETAASRYRSAIQLRATCSAARLGLGVALALTASRTGDALQRRGLELESLAQLTAVGARSELSSAARFDRVLLLDRVGRRDQARAAAREYLALDDTSAWALRLRSTMGLGEWVKKTR